MRKDPLSRSHPDTDFEKSAKQDEKLAKGTYILACFVIFCHLMFYVVVIYVSDLENREERSTPTFAVTGVVEQKRMVFTNKDSDNQFFIRVRDTEYLISDQQYAGIEVGVTVTIQGHANQVTDLSQTITEKEK